ncbi:MAG TPA: redox-regulated ATPase YchF [Polyangiaceae bacterium]|nr:redox-regulated ATPase YchF [Polyangiaceae bacterium]
MQVGITGYAAAGKTTVFNCLTGSDALTGFGGGKEANRANIKVPDDRIDELSAIFEPKKTTYATISFVDLPSPQDGGDNDALDPQTAGELRRMDALVHVVRGFDDEGVVARANKVDPLRDLTDFDTELALSDVVIIDGRIERLKKEGKKTRELETLEKLADAMEGGEKPARTLELDEATLDVLSGFQLLSLKPQIVLLNLGDDTDPDEATKLEDALRKEAEPRGITVMALRPIVEKEIAQLPPEDQASFLEDLGIEMTARPRFIRACYGMLNLISFFTVGEDEVRAWTITAGTHAQRAAGKIHSDLERGFIRAETVAYDDFMSSGKKLAKAREAGKLRLEGKDYVVADGDIINVRFNV